MATPTRSLLLFFVAFVIIIVFLGKLNFMIEESEIVSCEPYLHYETIVLWLIIEGSIGSYVGTKYLHYLLLTS